MITNWPKCGKSFRIGFGENLKIIVHCGNGKKTKTKTKAHINILCPFCDFVNSKIVNSTELREFVRRL